MGYAERELFWSPVGLAEVTGRAGDDDVFRAVTAATNERNQVIDCRGRGNICRAIEASIALHFLREAHVFSSVMSCRSVDDRATASRLHADAFAAFWRRNIAAILCAIDLSVIGLGTEPTLRFAYDLAMAWRLRALSIVLTNSFDALLPIAMI